MGRRKRRIRPILRMGKLPITGRGVDHIMVTVSRLTSLVVTTPDRIRSSVYQLTRVTHTTNVRLVLTAREPAIGMVANLVGTGMPDHVSLGMDSGASSHAVLSANNNRGLVNQNSVLFSPMNTPGPVHIRNYCTSSRRVRNMARCVGGTCSTRCGSRVRRGVGEVTTRRVTRNGGPNSSSSSSSRNLSVSDGVRRTVGYMVRTKRTSASLLREELGINCTETNEVVSSVRRVKIMNPRRNSGPESILVACGR